MLRNYFKIAWKVLLRRKFFTFISLFGISVTLMVLMVVTAMINHIFGAHTPEQKLDRMLFVSRIHMTGDGTEMNSSPSFYFLDRFVKPLKAPEMMSIYSNSFTSFNFTQGRKLSMDTRYTDSNFWRILDFEFIDGGAYGDAAVKNAQLVAVINETTSTNNFGTANAVGKTLVLDDRNYKVVGVVKNVPAMRTSTYAEVWLPYTTTKSDLGNTHYAGNSYNAVLLAKSPGDLDNVKKEFYAAIAKVPMMPQEPYTVLKVFADTNLESFVREITFSVDDEVNVGVFYGIVLGGMLFFMLIPTLNLVNINISRIMERASEIGVRKAFGASSNTLVLQFLFENIFLTVLGGIIGVLLAVGAMYLINSSNFIPYANLELNLTVLLFSLSICLFFGILSGVYPAFKMSKLHPATVLKGGAK